MVLLAALLGVADGLGAGRVALVAVAVLAGQLSVGWSNDAIDAGRDRTAGRLDKPVARGDLTECTVWTAALVAGAVCVPLSLACGWWAGVVHLGCVASAWVYNGVLKSTAWSFAPYAVSFGGLVVFVSLADRPSALPQWWLPVAAALLGVGAHLLNVLPDLEDDARTGIHGLPHRIGAHRLPAVATGVLGLGTLVVALGAGLDRPLVLGGLAVAAGLGVLAVRGRGRAPFLAAIAIALVDVLLLLLAQ